ncbi:GNAT domain [Macleaya cordata]|uniref:GNAT domain n=1 Tax=Macleaya cordata TaxID=56857 RepID=A0A200PX35_MACCD|nr:GNAT domain [Macleaya cordata]
MATTNKDIKIRSYDMQIDRSRVEDLERRCQVGPAESMFLLFTDTMGDPICRISNSPLYKMLVAEMDNELVGVIQGSIKIVTVVSSPNKNQAASVGYILGLRVSPVHRRKGIGSSLVQSLEEWFVTKNVDFAYMATEKDNEASVKLFMNKLGFIQFRTLSILVNPVRHHVTPIPSNVEIVKFKIEQAEVLYRRLMGSTEFFPDDIDAILKNKLSLGTWVAYPRGESYSWSDHQFEFNGLDGIGPSNSWAMLSVWNCGDLFKLRVGGAPLSCLIYAKSSRFIDRIFPCLNVPVVPDVFNPFGFYFMYGMHCEGPKSGPLMTSLCQFVHNMATTTRNKECKVIVTEVGEWDTTLRLHIPHSKLLSRPEDLWCIKALKTDQQEKHNFFELTRTQSPTAFFVDPREV